MADIQTYLTYLKRNEKQPVYKIELLRKEDETPFKSIEGDVGNGSGSLNITFSEGVRRTCNFTIENFNKQYIELVNDLNLSSKFKLYLGYKIDGINYYPQSQGIFLFNDPVLNSNLANKTISISGTDKFSGLNGTNGGNLEATYTVVAGTKVSDIIRSVLALDIVKDPIPPIIDSSLENKTITYGFSKQTGETVSSILFNASFNINAYVYYDENGALNLRPIKEDNQKGVIYSYLYNDVNYIGCRNQILFSKVHNSVVVMAENVQNSALPIYYEAINNDPTDRNSVANSIKKVKKITDYTKGISTLDDAKIRCEWELRKLTALGSSVNISSVPFYHLDVNEVITISDEYADLNATRLLINSITLPIGTNGNMTINAIKTVE